MFEVVGINYHHMTLIDGTELNLNHFKCLAGGNKNNCYSVSIRTDLDAFNNIMNPRNLAKSLPFYIKEMEEKEEARIRSNKQLGKYIHKEMTTRFIAEDMSKINWKE